MAEKTKKRNKTLVIINPRAGKLKTKRQLFSITDDLSVGGHEVTVYTTTCRGDATKLAYNLGKSYDSIVCRGGDGTLNEVVNGVMKLDEDKRPPIGYVPSGSANDFARSLNISSNPKKCVKHLLKGNPIPHDIGLFNKEKHFTYISCFGAFTDLTYNTSQFAKNIMGHAAYSAQIFNVLSKLPHNKVKVTFDDGEVVEEDIVYGAVSNTVSFAGVLKYKPDVVDFKDGKFEVLLVKYPKNLTEFNKIAKCIVHSEYDPQYICFKQVSSIKFEFENEVAWTLDGEYGGKNTVFEIENLNKAVKFIR